VFAGLMLFGADAVFREQTVLCFIAVVSLIDLAEMFNQKAYFASLLEALIRK
jgi:hypothetical protein